MSQPWGPSGLRDGEGKSHRQRSRDTGGETREGHLWIFLPVSLPWAPSLGLGLHPSRPSPAVGEAPGARGSQAASGGRGTCQCPGVLEAACGPLAAPPARIKRPIYLHAVQTIIY